MSVVLDDKMEWNGMECTLETKSEGAIFDFRLLFLSFYDEKKQTRLRRPSVVFAPIDDERPHNKTGLRLRYCSESTVGITDIRERIFDAGRIRYMDRNIFTR